MAENLNNALVITAFGMGLVFFGIVVLWGMMSLLMSLTAEKPSPLETEPEPVTQAADEASLVPTSGNTSSDRKRRAAIAAVAVALALKQTQLEPDAAQSHSVSAWQLRSRQFTTRGRK